MPQVLVKSMNNHPISSNYEEDFTVRMLKENIEHREGMSADQFALIYQGQRLDDTKRLIEYKIMPGHFVVMVPQLRGGYCL